MQYLGDKSPGATFTFWFTTADADGVPTALTSGAISVYKDNSDTQSTSGVTLSASADSITGANRVVIDTSADGTFYSAGSDFSVIITAGTVDGTSIVGYVVGRFTLSESAAYDAVAGLNDLDAAGVRDAVGLASADLDAQLGGIDGKVDAVKAKTDELTFTKAGAVDANVQYVNDTEVAGDGQPGTEWGPSS